jgi:hypothetical protein
MTETTLFTGNHRKFKRLSEKTIFNLQEGEGDEEEVIAREVKGVMAVTIETIMIITMEDMAGISNHIWDEEWVFQGIQCLFMVSKEIDEININMKC